LALFERDQSNKGIRAAKVRVCRENHDRRQRGASFDKNRSDRKVRSWRWSQPVDATLYLKEEMECMVMGQGFHRGFTAAKSARNHSQYPGSVQEDFASGITIVQPDIAANSANGARGFDKLQPNLARHALSFARFLRN
jgi:hypothetical protein